MHRIDNPSAVAVLPALQPPGVPGFFSNGNPRAIKLATLVDQDWLNTIQEEIAHVIEGAGLDLDKPSLDQLLLAIQLLVDRRLPPMPFLPIAGGTMQGPIYQHLAPTQPAELPNKLYVDDRDNAVIDHANTQDNYFHNEAVVYANARAIQEGDRAQSTAWTWDQVIWERVNWIDATQGGVAFLASDGVFTVPNAARLIEVWATAGGGGGGGNHAIGWGGGGGGAGGSMIGSFPVAPGQQFPFIIGQGGAGGGVNGSQGSPGAATQFGDLLGATGGNGGQGSNGPTPAGGEPGGGYGTGAGIPGGFGDDGWSRTAFPNGYGRGGMGGASFWGGGGRSGAPSGTAARAYGAGGGGAYSYDVPGVGGPGQSGLIMVRWNR